MIAPSPYLTSYLLILFALALFFIALGSFAAAPPAARRPPEAVTGEESIG